MVTLVILDGFGQSKTKFGNAIKSQGTPNLDKLIKMYPHTLLKASGSAVGLPDGVMGNSEVGHLTIGAGRQILQDLALINSEIENGKFYENPALIKALTHAEKTGGNLHLMGLFSDRGVHSDINHMYAILQHAKNFNINHIYIHAFLDGRDCGVHDGIKYIQNCQEKLQGTNASFGSFIGRIYAMDRENRWDRIEKAYNLLVFGKGQKCENAQDAVLKAYENGTTDEFFEPVLLNENAVFNDGDSVIFFNFRADRGRELSTAITDPNFDKFKTKKLKNFLFTPFAQYADTLCNLNTLYPPKVVEDNLAAVLSATGKTQFHIAETTKYAHVTFFLNGGIEDPYHGETRKLIDSINVQDFSAYPKMRAIEITTEVLDAIASQKYEFVVVNYSNPDMIGHTGNFNATKEAVECVEKQAYAVALATMMAGGDCIITADHGNAEEMIDKKGNKLTNHTTNPVMFILASEKHKKIKLKKGKTLSSIAPTILKLMDIPAPSTYDEPLF